MSKLLGYKSTICIVFVTFLISVTLMSATSSRVAAQELSCAVTDSELTFISLIEGDGPKPTDGQLVKVQYTGRLVNGATFSSAVGTNSYIFTLGQDDVIPGWDEGIRLLNEGGKAMLLVPPELGYGDTGAQYVPPESTLIFDVELLAILQGSPDLPADVDQDDYTETESGLRFYDVESGDGPSPEEDYLVSVHYTGWLSDGTKIDSTLDRDRPYVFRLGQERLIPGWDEGIRTMQVGSTRQFVVPPELAYGEDGISDIVPADETLIFDVELLSILRGSPASPTEIEEDDNTETESGLKFYDIEVGNSIVPIDGDTVSVHYTGWLSDGTKFESSLDRGSPFVFTLGRGEVIAGWEEGIRSMRIGGIRQLTIPPALAYGGSGYGGLIPPDETLLFEVELVDIQ